MVSVAELESKNTVLPGRRARLRQEYRATVGNMQTPESLPEWTAYVAEPSRATLFPLVTACDAAGCRSGLVAALGREFNAKRAWRVAQHAALEALQAGSLTLAHYWAHLAMTLSQGDVRARLALASVLWDRRIPRSVLYQTEICRALARRVRSRKDRTLLQAQIAAFSARALAYAGLVVDADRWLRFLERVRALDSDTVLAVLLGAVHRKNERLLLRAARLLAPVAQHLGPRPRAAVQAVLRRALLRLVGARASGA